jgi:F-type H+-transporting ATPase subunit alpha
MKQQLARGERMVELLKQDQYQPMAVEKQILVIYAGVNGYLDEVPVTAVRKFEGDFIRFVEQNHPSLLGQIREKKQIDDALKGEIVKAIEAFKPGFKAE